eukprot:g3233.t1
MCNVEMCCRNCGRRLGCLMITLTLIMLLVSCAGVGVTSHVLIHHINLMGLPETFMYVACGLCVLMSIISLLGVIGSCQMRAQALDRGKEGVELHRARCGRWPLYVFIILTLLAAISHAACGFVALDYGKTLKISDATPITFDSNDTVQSMHKATIEYINKNYALRGPAGCVAEQCQDPFTYGDWMKTQKFFDCCGYDREHPYMMTNLEACNYPLPGPGRRFVLEGVDNEHVNSGPFQLGSIMSGKETCSEALEELFVNSGFVFIGIALFELIVVSTAIALICVARCFRPSDDGSEPERRDRTTELVDMDSGYVYKSR